MSALTWRNVSSPDFTGSATMFKTMAEQLDKATSGLSTGLKDWQGARMSRAEDQIAQQASQYDSPEAYRAALASGQILSGVDQGLIGKKLIEAAAGQESVIAAREKQGAQYAAPEVENLLKQALLAGNEPAITALTQQHAKTLRLTNSEFADPLKVRGMINNSRVGNVERTIQNAILNGDRPLVDSLTNNPEIAQLLHDTKSKFADPLNVDDMFYGRSVSDSKKRVGSLVSQMDNLVLSGNPDSARNMRNDPEVMKVLIEANHPYADARNFENSLAGDALVRLENDVANTSLDINKLEKVKAAMAAASGNPALQSRIAQNFGNMLTPSFELAAAQQSGMQPPTLDKTEVGASSPATDAIAKVAAKGKYTNANDDPTSGANTVVGDGKFKVPSLEGKLIAKLTIGELEPIQKELIDATRGRTDVFKELTPTTGSSALGKYQIVRATMQKVAPIVFGKDWKNVQFSEENQDKMGEYLFRETVRSGMPLSKQWVGLGKKEFGGKYSDPAKAKNLSWEEVKKDLFASESKPEKTYTKQDTVDNAIVAQAIQANKSRQINAFDAAGYASPEVDGIANNDTTAAYALFKKASGNVSTDNFTERDFINSYKKYGWVETPASKDARKKDPKLAPIKERLPIGRYAIALAKSTEDFPSFGSQRNETLNGGFWNQLTGAFRSNVFFVNKEELARQVEIAGGIDSDVTANNAKAADELAKASATTPEKLNAAASELEKARLLYSVSPTKEYAKLVETLTANYEDLKKRSNDESASRTAGAKSR